MTSNPFTLTAFQSAALQISNITIYQRRVSEAEPISRQELATSPQLATATESKQPQLLTDTEITCHLSLLNDIAQSVSLLSVDKLGTTMTVHKWWVGDAFSVNSSDCVLPLHPKLMQEKHKRELWREICDYTFE